jgi:hypothetical protein
MSVNKPCLRCGHEMAGHWSHICPRCGKFFAFYTPAQVMALVIVGTIVAVAVNVAIVAALWFWA